jgi:hypothetical protein
MPQVARWAAEARRHGHAPGYYNDSECHGCAVLRATDSALADVGHATANLTAPTEQASSPVFP